MEQKTTVVERVWRVENHVRFSALSRIKSFDVLSRFSQAEQARVRRQKSAQNALRTRPNASNVERLMLKTSGLT
jgi:hypothetical protein